MLVGAVLVVSGCTTSLAGQPQPVSSTGRSSQGGSSSGAAATSLPPRPAELSVAGVDPCALLPPDQRASLEIDQPPNRGNGTGDPLIGRTPLCSYSVAAWGAYGVQVSSTFTVAAWIEKTRNLAQENRVTSVAGYPAVVTYAARESGGCIVLVDIAADSVLALTIRDRRDYAMHDGKVVCANAEKAAGVALTTLRALQK